MQVKNKPCVKYITTMRLISWIHTHGSETVPTVMKRLGGCPFSLVRWDGNTLNST